ncbi:hypothetical protein D3C76_1505610 [compost metagenome]
MYFDFQIFGSLLKNGDRFFWRTYIKKSSWPIKIIDVTPAEIAWNIDKLFANVMKHKALNISVLRQKLIACKESKIFGIERFL